MSPYIYGLVDPTDSKHVRYVGAAFVNADRAWRHAAEAARCRGHNQHLTNWINALSKRGSSYSVLILEEFSSTVSKQLVGFVERCYIRSLREIGHDLINIMEGGQGGRGSAESDAKKIAWWTPERREEWRRLQLGSKHIITPEGHAILVQQNKNRNFTPVIRKKMSDAKKGKPLSLEHRASIGVAHLGISQDEASQAKRSVSLRAYHSDPANKEAIAERRIRQEASFRKVAAAKSFACPPECQCKKHSNHKATAKPCLPGCVCKKHTRNEDVRRRISEATKKAHAKNRGRWTKEVQ